MWPDDEVLRQSTRRSAVRGRAPESQPLDLKPLVPLSHPVSLADPSIPDLTAVTSTYCLPPLSVGQRASVWGRLSPSIFMWLMSLGIGALCEGVEGHRAKWWQATWIQSCPTKVMPPTTPQRNLQFQIPIYKCCVFLPVRNETDSSE